MHPGLLIARSRISVPAPMPTSLAITSTAAPSGGSSRATALSLNVCPYRATSVLHRRPRILGSIKATSIVTRGETPAGRVNVRKLAGTSEADLKAQQKMDDAAAAHDAALFAQRVRKRLGLMQLEFSRRIGVSLETIRNWEQGKRRPTGAAKTLLRGLDKAREGSLMALG